MWSWLAILVCLAAAAWLLFFLSTRHQAKPSAQETLLRSALVLRDGRLYPQGSEKPFTGFVIERWPGGEMQSRSSVSNGLLEGLSEGWHTNGQRQVEEIFHDGVSDGLRTKWHPNGKKLSEANIKAGKIEGIFRRWDESGALSEEILMRDGNPDGLSRGFYPSGFLRAEARMERGKILEQHFWKDGEKNASEAPGMETKAKSEK